MDADERGLESTHDSTFVRHLRMVLLLNLDARSSELHRECILIDLLQEPDAQGIADPERTTDDGFGQLNTLAIGSGCPRGRGPPYTRFLARKMMFASSFGRKHL